MQLRIGVGYGCRYGCEKAALSQPYIYKTKKIQAPRMAFVEGLDKQQLFVPKTLIQLLDPAKQSQCLPDTSQSAVKPHTV